MFAEAGELKRLFWDSSSKVSWDFEMILKTSCGEKTTELRFRLSHFFVSEGNAALLT
jgi:hypothetical protein